MNMKVNEDNSKALGMVNGQYKNIGGFQAMNF